MPYRRGCPPNCVRPRVAVSPELPTNSWGVRQNTVREGRSAFMNSSRYCDPVTRRKSLTQAGDYPDSSSVVFAGVCILGYLNEVPIRYSDRRK
jgi:hypothetical protein